MLKKEQYLKTVRRLYPPLFNSLIMMGYANKSFFAGLLKEPFSLTNMVHVDAIWYYGLSDFKKGGHITITSWQDNSLFEYAKEEFKKREDNLTNSAEKSFEDFCRAYQEYMPALALIFVVDKPAETALRNALLKKISADEVDDLMHKLNIPSQDNFYKQEEYDLVIGSDSKKHVDKYKWLYARYGEEREYTLKEAQTKLKNIDKKKFLKKWKKNKEELRQIISDAKLLLKDDAWLVDIFQYIIYYRTHRTDVMNKSAFLAMPMLKMKADSLGISYEQLLRCSANEILTNKIPSKKILDSRIRDCSAISENGKVFLLEGKKSREIIDFFKEDFSATTAIKGGIACKGNVKGRAKLIFNNKDFVKIEDGDILVTSMTTPEMVPIMKKASAFITDEGGITCHAAIIARELKKPCIIGTKIATQIFKDGDWVEVDADKGIVRKI